MSKALLSCHAVYFAFRNKQHENIGPDDHTFYYFPSTRDTLKASLRQNNLVIHFIQVI